MTNEEAYNIISEFCFTGYEDNKKPSFKLFGAIHELILDVEENTKLKAEIEQLKWKLSSTETQRDLKGYDAKRNAETMSSQLKMIKQLKSTNAKLCEEIDCLNTQIAESNKEGVSILHDMLELREENERLYATIGRQAKAKDVLEEQIEQLKAELEDSKIDKSCVDCRYGEVSGMDEPCHSCHYADMWEKEE